MPHSRAILRDEYRLSDLRSELDVASVPDDARTMHTLFAVLINDIDRRADVHQSIKPEILEGLAQAWLYFAEQEDGVDVAVEQHPNGVDTTVDDPADDRPASSMHTSVGESPFDESLRETEDRRVPLAEFERDMRRLDDLRRKHASPGTNSVEDREAKDLRDKYGLEHREWWQRQYLSEQGSETDNTTTSQNAVSASR